MNFSQVLSKKDKQRSIWVRMSEEDFKRIKEIASLNNLTLGQFTRKKYLEEIEERSIKVPVISNNEKKQMIVKIFGTKQINKEEGDDKEGYNDQGVLKETGDI